MSVWGRELQRKMAAISVLYTVQVFPGQDADYQQALIGVLFKCVLWEWQFPGVKEKRVPNATE